MKEDLKIMAVSAMAGVGIAAIIFLGTALFVGFTKAAVLPGGALGASLLYGSKSRMKWEFAGIPAICGVLLFHGIIGLLVGSR